MPSFLPSRFVASVRFCRAKHTFLGRSPVRRFKKCRFQASGALIETEDDVSLAIAEVVSDKKVSKASHPAMYAWILGDKSGSSDGGESGSGRVLLSLLQSMSRTPEGILVAVTRWYGGSQLGPARFREIRSTARDFLLSDIVASAINK